MLVVFAGLPGTGKSTLARAVAARVSGAVIDKDTLRAALFDPAGIEYTPEQDDFCMRLMLETAEWLWTRQRGRTVMLDGRTFSRAYQINTALSFAEARAIGWRIIECQCTEETARIRLEADAGRHPARNRNFALYQELKRTFEPITRPKLVVDTDRPVDGCVRECEVWITP